MTFPSHSTFPLNIIQRFPVCHFILDPGFSPPPRRVTPQRGFAHAARRTRSVFVSPVQLPCNSGATVTEPVFSSYTPTPRFARAAAVRNSNLKLERLIGRPRTWGIAQQLSCNSSATPVRLRHTNDAPPNERWLSPPTSILLRKKKRCGARISYALIAVRLYVFPPLLDCFASPRFEAQA